MLWLLSPSSLFIFVQWPGVGGPCLEGLLGVARQLADLRACGRGSNSVFSLCSCYSKAVFSKSLDIAEAHPQFSKEDRYTPCPSIPSSQPQMQDSCLSQADRGGPGGRAY